MILLCDTKIRLIAHDENTGIATALNRCLYWAIKRGYKWVLLFDQYTVPVNSMLETLASVYENFPDKSKLATVQRSS